jgi:hypothetical protein
MSEKKATRQRKKQPQVVAHVSPSGITGSLGGTQRPLIAYLPVKTAQLEAQTPMSQIQYNHSTLEPQPFDSMDENMSYLGQKVDAQEIIKNDEASVEIIPPPSQQQSMWSIPPVPTVREAVEREATVTQWSAKGKEEAPARGSLPCYYSEKLMVQYQDKNRLQALPEKTDIHCFWDCHEFSGTPCVIPSNISEGVWRVYGNFCSPNCATAYLFSQRLDAGEQWERYSKLNRLYHNFCQSASQGIQAAPAREILRIFGGSLDITEYRELLFQPSIRVDVLTPPMVSIIQSMDTKPIDFYEAALKNVFIQNDGEKLQKAGAMGLKLRRSKPIREKENTLEFCMKIK